MSKYGSGVSVVITAHAEGDLSHRTVRSACRAARFAAEHFPVELIAVLDAPTPATDAYFSRHSANFAQLHRVAFQDVALARNFGIHRARGRYVAILDGDDLVSANWLTAAVQQLTASGQPRGVYHPEYTFSFGAQTNIFPHIDQAGPEYRPWCLLEANYWTALCLTERDFALEVPYQSARHSEGWGYEDWHWNCEVIAAGGIHHVVPGTVHFVRLKDRGSRNADARHHRALLRSSKFFDQLEQSSRSRKSSATAIPGPSAARSFATRAKDFLRDKPRLNAAARRMWRALHVALPQRRPAATVAVHYPPLPDWFLAEWQAMHQIEPALLPTTDRGSSIPRYHVPHSWGAAAYQQAAAQWKLDRTHVFLLPWIKRGGSDLEILHHMRALSELGCTRQLCITTETCDSPWLSHVPTGTDVLEFGKLCKQHQLGEEVSLAVLARLLVQRSPEVVHIANSLLGLRLYARHGQALSKVSRLFLSIFCPDYSVDGYGGYAYEFLETLFPHLSAVFCDNQRFVDEVVEKYDFGRDRFQVLRFPTESTAPTRNAASGERLQVVWASRLDRQKRPDVLLEVIERCQPLPVQFHVYGSPALECNSYPQRLRACANVKYHGEYDGFASLPIEKFDVFLYTSQWDGMPNVLLEGMAAGLACIAPDVGGIAEVLSADNGCLVSRCDAISEYVAAVERLAGDRNFVAKLRRSGPEYIARHRTWAGFVEQLRGNRQYVPPTAVMTRETSAVAA